MLELYEFHCKNRDGNWERISEDRLRGLRLQPLPLHDPLIYPSDRASAFPRFASVAVSQIQKGCRVFLRTSGKSAEMFAHF
jgi:hypothetical protein